MLLSDPPHQSGTATPHRWECPPPASSCRWRSTQTRSVSDMLSLTVKSIPMGWTRSFDALRLDNQQLPRLGFACDSPGNRLGFACDSPENRLGFACDSPKNCLEFVYDSPGNRLGIAWQKRKKIGSTHRRPLPLFFSWWAVIYPSPQCWFVWTPLMSPWPTSTPPAPLPPPGGCQPSVFCLDTHGLQPSLRFSLNLPAYQIRQARHWLGLLTYDLCLACGPSGDRLMLNFIPERLYIFYFKESDNDVLLKNGNRAYIKSFTF